GRATEETRVPRGRGEGDPQGPAGGGKRGPRPPGSRGQGRPALRGHDRAGDRNEGGPRHRTRGDARPRLPPVVLREHAEGHEDEGGRPVPETREGPRGHPARGGDGGRASEAREDRMDRPKTTDGKGGLQSHRLRTLPTDRGPAHQGARPDTERPADAVRWTGGKRRICTAPEGRNRRCTWSSTAAGRI